jgi:subtilisin family serine protease
VSARAPRSGKNTRTAVRHYRLDETAPPVILDTGLTGVQNLNFFRRAGSPTPPESSEEMKTRFLGLQALIAVFLLSATMFAASPQGKEPYHEFQPGEVLVQFKPGVTSPEISGLCSGVGGSIVEYSDLLDFYRLRVSRGAESDAVAKFRSSPEVEWANFNYIVRACFVPNDPFYPFQWHYPRINLPQAWDITRGSSNVIVAVCDMGFYFDHEDWVGVVTTSPHDFIGNDNDPSTTVYDSHGEHVAGTIFAATDNNLGVAGIAPLCVLMPIRVLDDSGRGTVSQVAQGIQWATTHGADVINLSIAIPVSGPPSDPGPPLSTAISQAGAAGLIICAGAGNDYQPYVAYPAAYTACIAVGATGYDDARAPYSNYGAALDVVAPGGNALQDLNHDGYPDAVLSTLRDAQGDYYDFWQGTSMATPHVSGVAALLLSHGLQPAQVRTALQETALDLGAAGRDDTFGYGRIDALAALQWNSGGDIVLLDEGFEGSWPPAGWNIYAMGAPNPDNWQPLAGNDHAAGGTIPHSGTNAAFHNDDDTNGDQHDWFVTPQLNIPTGVASVTFRFYERNYWVPDYYQGNSFHGVLYSTNGADFTQLIELDQARNNWTQVNLDVSFLQGQHVWFAFLYIGDYATEWYIDDVRLAATPQGRTGRPRPPSPATVALGDPYPSPFNSVVQIPLELSVPARVELAVFNVLGQRVTTIVPRTELGSGSHRFSWRADNLPSGLYIVRLKGDLKTQTRKLLLIK